MICLYYLLLLGDWYQFHPVILYPIESFNSFFELYFSVGSWRWKTKISNNRWRRTEQLAYSATSPFVSTGPRWDLYPDGSHIWVDLKNMYRQVTYGTYLQQFLHAMPIFHPWPFWFQMVPSSTPQFEIAVNIHTCSNRKVRSANPSKSKRSLEDEDSRDPLYWYGLTLIPSWIRNYIDGKMWDEITDPFQNFNGAAV